MGSVQQGMSDSSFTLILTRSSHAINAATAATIRKALTDREPSVDVEMALYSDEMRLTTINTAHVIAIAERKQPTPFSGLRLVSNA